MGKLRAVLSLSCSEPLSRFLSILLDLQFLVPCPKPAPASSASATSTPAEPHSPQPPRYERFDSTQSPGPAVATTNKMPAGRLPTQGDFPDEVTLSITPPPTSHPPTNVLVLLHGLGDTHASFTRLGQQMNLPDTACLSVRAPQPLPFDIGGFHWGDDLVFDQKTGVMDMDTGFKASTKLLLQKVIKEGLMDKCGYTARDIVIFGYAQGAMVALQLAAEHDGAEFGGVVAVGGLLSMEVPLKALDKKSKTPVLVCKASKNSAVTDGAATRLKDAFEFIEIKEWKRNGDGMPSNRDEMMSIMQFFARRLRSVRGVPAGSVELK